MLPLPTIDLIRRSEHEDPIDDRKLRRALASGAWIRVAPGVFAPSIAWEALTPRDQHLVRVRETARRMRQPALLSHFSAAAIWGMDVLRPWPTRLDTVVAGAQGGRSSGNIRRHVVLTGEVESHPWQQHRVTSPAQTAADLARWLPFVEAVAVLDSALCDLDGKRPLATSDDVLARLDVAGRGAVRARRALAFASNQAANVRESQARALIARLGFPTPRLQERRVLRTGRLVFGDFSFPSHDHWLELDGDVKYLNPQFGGHRSADEIVLDEKRREDEIRREVRGFSRISPSDVDRPRRLFRILTDDGLPSALPSP